MFLCFNNLFSFFKVNALLVTSFKKLFKIILSLNKTSKLFFVKKRIIQSFSQIALHKYKLLLEKSNMSPKVSLLYK